MRAFEILLEASGGMWDRMLEKSYGKDIQFQKDGEILDLLDVQVFPQDQRSSYKEKLTGANTKKIDLFKVIKSADLNNHTDEMSNDIKSYIDTQKAILTQQLITTPRNAAAMVVILGNNSKKLAFVKFTDAKGDARRPIYWQTSKFTEATGWAQIGKGLSATQKSSPLKLSPYQLVTAGAKYPITGLISVVTTKLNSRTDLPDTLTTGIPSMLTDLYKNASPIPTPGMDEYKGTLEVVIGETAAPLALVTGNRVSGSYQECEKQMLNPLGLSWKDFNQVAFGAHGGEISDSEMYAGDTKVIVSSKNSKGGANASLTGAMETIDANPKEFGKGTKFYKMYSNILPILEVLHQNENVPGVLAAAVLLKFLTQEESDYLKSIYGKSALPSSIKTYPGLVQAYRAKAILGSKVKNRAGETVVSKVGVDLNNPKYDLGYHLFGNVAKMLAIHLNKDAAQLTNFFKAILNKASMVQVYTKIESNDQGIWFSNFKLVWPPTFTGNIVIEHDHNTANAPKTKKLSFSFK
jgi:hypothetical protein